MAGLAAALQVASAVTSLISAVDWTVKHVGKLRAAKDNAAALYDKLDRLHQVLKSVDNTTKNLTTNHEHIEQHTREIFHCLEGCFRACEVSIRIINARIRGLVESETGSLGARFGFVSGEREIRSHEATIEGYLQMSLLCLIQLNGVSNSVGHDITHRMLQHNYRALEDILRVYHASVLAQPQPTQIGMTTCHSESNIRARTSSLPNITTALMLKGSEVQEVPLNLPRQRSSQHNLDAISAQIAEAVDHVEINNEVQVPAIGPVVDMPLAIAVKKNDTETVQILIDEGADVASIVDAYGWTLLHHAVFKRYEASLIELLKSPQVRNPSFLNTQNKKGHTALMLCAQQAPWPGSRTLARLLLEYEAMVDVEDECGRTALYFAVKHSWKPRTDKFVQILVEGGATFGVSCQEVPRTAEDYDEVADMLPGLGRVNTSRSAISSRGFSSDERTDPAGDRSRGLLAGMRKRRNTK